MFVSFFPCGVFAEDEDVILTYPKGDGFEAVGFERDSKPKSDDEICLMSDSECEDYMAQQCLLRSDEIDIHRFNIPLDNKENFWYYFTMKHPELPLETSFEYDWYPEETIICSIYPRYLTNSFEEDEQLRQTLNDGVDEIISRAASCDDPLGKLLIIHDEIIKDCEYDSDYLPEGHNAYGFFLNHKMVCQGYAQLYYYICERLGIESGFCRSEIEHHIWNYVFVNGSWHHVDLTWDDPIVTSQPSGTVVHRTTANHDHFLVSDATAEDFYHEKETWISSLGFLPDCDDRFESRHIFNLPHPFTISYDGERFSVPYDVNRTTTVNLTSEEVYTGEIITSDIEKSSVYFTQYCYCLEDISTSINKIVLIKSSDGRYLSMTQGNKGTKSKDTVFKETYSLRSVPKNAEVSFMYWKQGTMTPITAKTSIINK